MIILGLTGSIGMGKSTTAEMFRQAGIKVYDADATVHTLYSGAATRLVEAAFPGTSDGTMVDRKKLGDRVLGDKDALKRLEAIIHPLVHAEQQKFLDAARKAGAKLVVLDIPLLFEGGRENTVDAVIVVTASENTQRERVLARPGMTKERFESILEKQIPDAIKRQKADFLIDTDMGMDAAKAKVSEIIQSVSDGKFQKRKS
ncbi:MAG: dephospho-CoA kinase [Hyphomicrobiales bacterium]|nr:MAG: dephospho-CoA kinase [Hyphomicrobiales bacterium]